MKYLLLIYSAETELTAGVRETCMADSIALCRELDGKGQFLLRPVATAKSVRIREGQRFVTDGPFAETTEQLGGYYLINATNDEEAVNIAARIPGAKWGTVEVRPVMEVATDAAKE